MDKVEKTKESILITRNGKPVAKIVSTSILDFGQNERVLGQKTRERENAKTGQRKELDTVSFSTMADWINNSVL